MSISKCTISNASELAFIIKEANKDVAEQFSLNINNCPTHPSFCTTDWIIKDFKKDAEYFIYKKDEKTVACVSFENPREGVAYLNRLCVLPSSQGNKIGEELVHYIIAYAKSKDIKSVRIAIIENHIKLKDWYLYLGFEIGLIKEHNHLPFKVMQLSYTLK